MPSASKRVRRGSAGGSAVSAVRTASTSQDVSDASVRCGRCRPCVWVSSVGTPASSRRAHSRRTARSAASSSSRQTESATGPWSGTRMAALEPASGRGSGRGAADDVHGLTGYLPLLVRRYDQHGDLAALRGDRERLGPPVLVAVGVHGDAEPLQAGEGGGPQGGGVLPPPGREDDGVDHAEDGVVGADVLADAVAEDVEREPGRGV